MITGSGWHYTSEWCLQINSNFSNINKKLAFMCTISSLMLLVDIGRHQLCLAGIHVLRAWLSKWSGPFGIATVNVAPQRSMQSTRRGNWLIICFKVDIIECAAIYVQSVRYVASFGLWVTRFSQGWSAVSTKMLQSTGRTWRTTALYRASQGHRLWMCNGINTCIVRKSE